MRKTARDRAIALSKSGGDLFEELAQKLSESRARRWITQERRRVAFHEAGHAVVGLSLGIVEIDAVTIRRGDDYLGRCHARPTPKVVQRGRRWVVDPGWREATAVMLLAGLTAESLRDDGFVDAEDLLSRFECNDLGGATKDFEQALALLGEAGHKGRKLEAAKWRTGPGFRLSPASCVAKGSPMPRR